MNDDGPQIPEGFTLAYSRGAGEFRFYVCAVIAAASLVAIFLGGGSVALVLMLFFGGVAYYFYPLIENNKPRIGAGQYGIFIDGFGIIGWRAVGDIVLRHYAVRNIDNVELHITLTKPLEQALITDWHKLPIHRMLMMLPWRMTPENVVRIKLEPFGPAPKHIHGRFMQAWRLFGKA